MALNAFQIMPIQSQNFWKGITKTPHIRAMFQKSPVKASQYMTKILALNYKPSLESLLVNFPTQYFETDDEYYWDIVTNSDRNIPLVEARLEDNSTVVTSSTSTNIGIYGTPFYLVFAEDWFSRGEIIGGNLNEAYPIRVLEEPIQEGSYYVYKVALTGAVQDGIPAERLLAGERFSPDFAPAERDFSRKQGDIRFSSPTSMRNEWTTIRIQHTEPGSALKEKLACGIPVVENINGKQVPKVKTFWMHYVNYEIERQFADQKNRARIFGRANRDANGEYHDFGFSGNVITMGSGLYEQMGVANKYYYNKFSLDYFVDALSAISAGRLNYNQRTFVVTTGEQGAILFHKEILRESNGWTQVALDPASVGLIRKTNNKVTDHALGYGAQFTEFLAPNGIRIILNVEPFYDDPVRNKVTINGRPAMSRRFDIFSLGTPDQPNICKAEIKGQPEKRGYTAGPFSNPFTGEENINYAASDEDSATIHIKSTFGIYIKDPTATMSFIPDVLKA